LGGIGNVLGLILVRPYDHGQDPAKSDQEHSAQHQPDNERRPVNLLLFLLLAKLLSPYGPLVEVIVLIVVI
jgi:hypothetical protein